MATHSVLLIEDEAPAALALGDALQAEGYLVYRAEDGEAGLASALENHPDIILLDLKLPKMGGMDVLNKLREDAWGKDAKIIVLTNASDLSTLQEVMSQGTFHYLTKADASVSDVSAAIADLLSKDTAK